MNSLEHNGYIAAVELDADSEYLHGRVINTRDVLTFEGRTVAELKAAFADTIADYLEWCQERGEEPEKPYSGRLLLRLRPEVHSHLAAAAARAGKSLNSFVAEALEKVAS